ncbi:hypothetical protein GGR53DRAFT_494154 [Hypoxylon sp. FL1150]|nr:hypothetical protein GGR53DRAFT_494154 [Hypoxylon sp. FL1150]
MPPKTWGPELFQDIAVAVWDVAKLTPEQVDRVIQKINSKGYPMTKEAVRQRIQKIIRAENAAAGSNGGEDQAEAGTSPRPRATATPSKGKAITKRKAAGGEDDDSEQEIPKKRVKKETRKAKKAQEEDVKDSPSQDNDEWSGREEAREALLGRSFLKGEGDDDGDFEA